MHSTMTRRVYATVATVLVVGLMAGCSSAEDQSTGASGEAGVPVTSPLEDINLVVDDGPGTPGGRIVYGLNAETDGWNPTSSRWSPAGLEVAKTIYDTLAAYDEDLGWQPNLAEAFEPSDDYLSWKIVLRDGITFHSGTAVTAAAVAESMNVIAAAPLTQQPFEPVKTITATGPLEITVDMDAPWVNFPYALTTQIGVVPDPAWLATGDTRSPVGTGAFVFDSWEPGRKLVVKKNQNWWRDGLPYLDEIEFVPFPDELSRVNALQKGELDIIEVTTGDQIAKMKDVARGNDGFQVVNDPRGETNEVFVMLNTKQAPLDDPDARRALALATDAQGYIDSLGQGQYVRATGPFAEDSPWYAPTEYPSYDLEAARALVQQVKDRHGGTFAVTLNMPIGGGSSSADGSQLLQSMWQDAGVTVTVESIDLTQVIAAVVTGQYQATLFQQFDSPHPLGDSIWWHPNSSGEIGEFALNFARNENPRIGELLDAARRTTDPAQEAADYQQVSQELGKDIPYIWLYHSQISIAASTDLVNIVDYTLPNGTKGLALHGGAHPLYQVWIRR